MDIVESSAIHESDVYHYDTPEGFRLYQQLDKQKALSLFSSKYGFLLPLVQAYREAKCIEDQDSILRTLRDHKVPLNTIKDVFGAGSGRVGRLVVDKLRLCDILTLKITNDINDFLKIVDLHVKFECEHLRFVMFSPPICRLDDAYKLYNSLPNVDHVSNSTFRKNLEKYGKSNRVRFLFQKAKVPLCCFQCCYKVSISNQIGSSNKSVKNILSNIISEVSNIEIMNVSSSVVQDSSGETKIFDVSSFGSKNSDRIIDSSTSFSQQLNHSLFASDVFSDLVNCDSPSSEALMESSSLFIEESDVKKSSCIHIFPSEFNNQNEVVDVSSFDPKKSDTVIDSSTSFSQQSDHSFHASNIISCSKRKIIDLSSDSEIRQTIPDNKTIIQKKNKTKILDGKTRNPEKINSTMSASFFNRGFQWKNNSCSFDCIMNILMQFYFQVGFHSDEKDSFLNNMGCLGFFLRDFNGQDEFVFDCQSFRDDLYEELRKRG
jgi:hypothetical protein